MPKAMKSAYTIVHTGYHVHLAHALWRQRGAQPHTTGLNIFTRPAQSPASDARLAVTSRRNLFARFAPKPAPANWPPCCPACCGGDKVPVRPDGPSIRPPGDRGGGVAVLAARTAAASGVLGYVSGVLRPVEPAPSLRR